MQTLFTVDFHTYEDMDSLDNVTFHTLHACSKGNMMDMMATSRNPGLFSLDNVTFHMLPTCRKDNMMDMAAMHRLSARVPTHVLINENFAIE